MYLKLPKSHTRFHKKSPLQYFIERTFIYIPLLMQWNWLLRAFKEEKTILLLVANTSLQRWLRLLDVMLGSKEMKFKESQKLFWIYRQSKWLDMFFHVCSWPTILTLHCCMTTKSTGKNFVTNNKNYKSRFAGFLGASRGRAHNWYLHNWNWHNWAWESES